MNIRTYLIKILYTIFDKPWLQSDIICCCQTCHSSILSYAFWYYSTLLDYDFIPEVCADIHKSYQYYGSIDLI